MFTITIIETKNVETLTEKAWAPCIEENGKKEWGYTPQVNHIHTTNTKRLEQTVDTLDFQAVIKAINGLA